ncbi:hypothetical protein F4859DRAFT_474763 [Xylaria cf. heliscus]|nr:hypothetical protein F4859DRAFT_474763 [Xylaria cf. heliscus]
MDKKKKLVFQLDTPYSAVSWPQIPQKDQDVILQLLCNLLSPIGHYRSQHIHASKGNRAKKRKRQETSDKETTLPVPPVPELKSYVDIGLSCVTNSLQKTASGGARAGSLQDDQGPMDRQASRFYSAIFVARSGQPNALSSHLPQMVAVACKSHPSLPPTRLVELPRACEGRLYEALGIPRVSCIGICVDAPNSDALVNFTREHVPVVKVLWLEEASCAEYQGTKINTIETIMGAKKKMRDKTAK